VVFCTNTCWTDLCLRLHLASDTILLKRSVKSFYASRHFFFSNSTILFRFLDKKDKTRVCSNGPIIFPSESSDESLSSRLLLEMRNSASLWLNGALGGEIEWARFSCTRQKKTLSENKAGRLDLPTRVPWPVFLISKARVGICVVLEM